MHVCWNHRKRYCLPARWHQLPSRRLGVNAYMRAHIFGCTSVFGRVSSASPFLPSRLCIIGLKPAKPFVCVLPCAYINSAALLNNFANWTNSATDFPPLFLASIFFSVNIRLLHMPMISVSSLSTRSSAGTLIRMFLCRSYTFLH